MLRTPQHLMIVRLMGWKPTTFRWTKELNNKSDDVSDAALLKQLCFPYSTAELSLVKVNYFELTPWLITLKSPG